MPDSPLIPPPEKRAEAASHPERVTSADALRGFAMFWIIGGGGILSTIATRLKPVEWAGFRFFDGIFPLFLFLAGVAIG